MGEERQGLRAVMKASAEVFLAHILSQERCDACESGCLDKEFGREDSVGAESKPEMIEAVYEVDMERSELVFPFIRVEVLEDEASDVFYAVGFGESEDPGGEKLVFMIRDDDGYFVQRQPPSERWCSLEMRNGTVVCEDNDVRFP